MHTSVLKNDDLGIEYLRDPLQIIGLTPADKTNVLVDLTNLPAVPTPFGDLHFCGGHRICNGGPATIKLSDPSFVRQTLSIEQRFWRGHLPLLAASSCNLTASTWLNYVRRSFILDSI